jgi:hypothetical protein
MTELQPYKKLLGTEMAVARQVNRIKINLMKLRKVIKLSSDFN